MKKYIKKFLLSFLLLVTFSIPTYADENLEVHFIDVGQGLSILAKSGDDVMVYDGGDRKHSSIVVSYLKKQGITDIDYLISSHYDEDHIAGLVGCLNAFEIGMVIGPDYEKDTKTYQAFVDGVAANDLFVEHPDVGEIYEFGDGSFTVLSPSVITNDDNDNSVAIKLTDGDKSFIFTGDAEAASESNMIASWIDLSCDVLCLGHHGSASSTSYDFLSATVPEYAVISCGQDNKYGHPHKDTMDKLEAMEIEIFRTDKQGTLVARSNEKEIIWNQTSCGDYSPGERSDKGTVPQCDNEEITISEEYEQKVWIFATGNKYHATSECGSRNSNRATEISVLDAEEQGYSPCKRCFRDGYR